MLASCLSLLTFCSRFRKEKLLHSCLLWGPSSSSMWTSSCRLPRSFLPSRKSFILIILLIARKSYKGEWNGSWTKWRTHLATIKLGIEEKFTGIYILRVKRVIEKNTYFCRTLLERVWQSSCHWRCMQCGFVRWQVYRMFTGNPPRWGWLAFNNW